MECTRIYANLCKTTSVGTAYKLSFRRLIYSKDIRIKCKDMSAKMAPSLLTKKKRIWTTHVIAAITPQARDHVTSQACHNTWHM
jgi:hypothetical protein